MKKIAFAGPSITEKEISYTTEAAASGWYENYQYWPRKLEETLQSYLGGYLLATQTGTAALHCAAAVLAHERDVKEIICTDFSWAATANALAAEMRHILFADIEPDTWCIDPNSIENLMDKRIDAIMVVHAYGVPANMTEIVKSIPIYKGYLIEDACPALGATHKDRLCGTFGDFAAISFHGAKIAAAGEGGALRAQNKQLHDLANIFANHGRTDSRGTFWCDGPGLQYTMGSLPAAFATAQVERLEELLTKKKQIWDWYQARLGNHPRLRWQKAREGDQANYAYPSALLVDSRMARKKFITAMTDYNIHARPTFPQISTMPLFCQSVTDKGNPVTAEVAKLGVSFPSAFNLTEQDIDFVCQRIDDLI